MHNAYRWLLKKSVWKEYEEYAMKTKAGHKKSLKAFPVPEIQAFTDKETMMLLHLGRLRQLEAVLSRFYDAFEGISEQLDEAVLRLDSLESVLEDIQEDAKRCYDAMDIPAEVSASCTSHLP